MLVAPNCSDMFGNVECFLDLLTSVDVKLKVTSIVHLYREVKEIKGCSVRKYTPNSRCRLSSCRLAVLVMFFDNSLPWNEYNVPPLLTSKATQPRRKVFSINGSIICKFTALLTSSVQYGKILPNLVNSSWLWWIMRVILANQKRRNILNEW